MRKLANEELDRKSIDEFKAADKIPVVVILDDVRSLHNVGSTFRTCDAFLIEKLYLAGITGSPPHREINKTALGSTESVIWEHVSHITDLIVQLKKEGYIIISVEQVDKSTPLNEFQVDKSVKYCLVFGNEVFGVNEQVIAASDHSIEIPQEGTKHSLNISVSLGIVVWEFWNKLAPSVETG
ncbi:RNA methyltransferase [Fulvivirga sp. M361]|uniref:RNA methyltransferase n=1 Tax=Fulvivirga sp. M361 TaxID=2594266 RepID=UPI00117B9C54|nr:RNA methyltransferase [Fulvivirga sp. M361]TRX62663.1 RNA methyltransferase [Fulvivirga sp. M361]